MTMLESLPEVPKLVIVTERLLHEERKLTAPARSVVAHHVTRL